MVGRWSQIVRTVGQVRIIGHHATEIVPESGLANGEAPRPGLRLLVHPVAMLEPVTAIDIASTAVQAMLEGFLAAGVASGRLLSWRASGFGVRRRDTLIING
jgi:hypothetical protein